VKASWSSAKVEVRDVALQPEDTLAGHGVALADWHDFGHLHLACHGSFDPADPLAAALYLGRDRILAGDVFKARLKARVVSLSACDVGRRAHRIEDVDSAFDEWLGLYLPLFGAGAQMVLASRWQADSQKALQFMAAFHTSLAGGQTPAMAMRSACAGLMRRPDYFWANWALVGVPDDL
jgi:CHAT domain-containing protein